MSKKFLLRKELMILSNKKPAQEELEIYHQEKGKFLTAVMIRWFFLFTLSGFLFFSIFFFSLNQDVNLVFSAFLPYIGLTIFIAVYNSILSYFNEKIAVLKGATKTQIAIDIIFISIFLYLAGGIISWFWVLFPVLIFETAFLFEGGPEIWFISIASSLMFLLVLIIQSYNGITQATYPFAILVPSEFSVYAVVITSWVLAVNIFSGFSASYLSRILLQKRQHLEKRVLTDGLTGLYDHNYFYKSLESEINRSERYNRVFSLILIDIDDFKLYNDRFGHQKGDQLLKEFSKILSQNIRKKGVDLVFRYGGEEFAIIAPEIDGQSNRPIGAIALAERLRKKVNEALNITISIGVGSYPIHGKNATDLFNNVDNALFEAKHKNKNRVVIAKTKNKEEAA